MNYKKIKRKAEDYCNICGKMAQLTWDHVPPKCCNNKYNVKTNAWFEGLPEENKYYLQYQNGIRYRSLCSKCNNDILGINYDTVLAEFTEEMMHILQTERNCLAEFVMPIQINRLSRAICGHLLAAKNYYEDNCIIDDWLREYVLNPNTLPPNEMRLLYWIYPYSTIFVIRDVNVLPNCSQFAFPKGTISAINCFPVSYLLTSEKEDTCGLVDLFEYGTENIDDVVDIPIRCSSCYFHGTNHIRPFLWPCNISDKSDGVGGILGCEEAMKDSRIACHSKKSVEAIKNRIYDGSTKLRQNTYEQ